MEPESYFEMLQKLLETYALPQEGTIYFSAADLARMPQKFEDVIEQTAQKKGGHLVVSKEPKDMDGGFVLVYGGIEENCTIRAMFHTKQDELSDVVQKNIICIERSRFLQAAKESEKEGFVLNELEYTYAVARIRAQEGSLLTQSVIEQLMACQNETQCLQLL